MAVTKAALVELIRAELRQRLETLTRAAREAHEAATDPGSRAESKYDTRSLEASYLAEGQARQVIELREALQVFETLVLPDFSEFSEVGPGALVTAVLDGEVVRFLLAPAGGGMEVACDGGEVTLLTPESPLYQKLLGLFVGDELEQPRLRVAGMA